MESLVALLAAAVAGAAPPASPARGPADAALAQLVIAPPTPAPVPLSEDALVALGSAAERMTVPVSINARGPWPFVIDTGAERTVVSRELAGVLGLSAGPPVRVIAMTGPARVGSVLVPQLSISRISRATIEAPALGARDLGAVGMLGIDALQGHAVSIDFVRGQMTLRPSRQRPGRHQAASPGEVIVTARSLFGQLIVTDAYWRSRRIAVIIDTGSPVTVGNGALLAAITRRPREIGPMTMTSATGGTLHANAFSVDRRSMGGSGFTNGAIAFAAGPPCARCGLAGRPALLLGMDVMRLFRRIDIDFSNREIRFSLPRGLASDGMSTPLP